MKIGVLIAGMSPYGAEKATARLAEGLQKDGQDVTVFLTDTESEIPLSVPVVPIRRGKPLTLLQEFLYAPVQYLRLWRIVNREKFDVLISVMERSNILNLLLPGSQRRVLTVHTFLSIGLRVSGIYRRVFTKTFYRLLLGRAALIGNVSKAAKADFQSIFRVDPDRLFVFHNPLDLEEIAANAAAELEPDHHELLDGNSILHVGRFSWDKGQWYLIRALPEILRVVPGARLILLGNGAMQVYLEKLVASLGLENHVHFLGFQQNPIKFMSRARLLVCSSMQEGFPVALVEALACGTAIVSADCRSGPRELLAPGTDFTRVATDIEEAQYGLLVPPFDGETKEAVDPLSDSEKSLADAAIRLLQNESLRRHYKERGRERAEELETARVVSSWMQQLNQLSANGKKHGPGKHP